MGLVYIFGTILTAGEKLKALNTIAASGLMVNLILNFILIPIYGALGAAVATIFTQGITSIVQVYFAFKQFKLSFSSSFKFQSITFFIVFGLVGWLIHTANFHVEVKILATLLFGGIYLLASKTIKIHSVKTIAET
jgi:O-antigen/teichoic acid export membrane protein